jgi:hypothetical protein
VGSILMTGLNKVPPEVAVLKAAYDKFKPDTSKIDECAAAFLEMVEQACTPRAGFQGNACQNTPPRIDW